MKLSRRIGIGVMIVHLLAVAAMSISHLASFRWKPTKPIAVRVVSPPASPLRAIEPVAASPRAAAPSPKPARKPAPAIAAAAPAKSAPKLSPSPSPPPRVRPQIHLPAPIEPTRVQAAIETADPGSYEQTLVEYLQLSLDLPERGEVKMAIALNQEGKLLSCDILESRSQKNGDFLKKRLLELDYPCFNDAPMHSFTITFRNAETL